MRGEEKVLLKYIVMSPIKSTGHKSLNSNSSCAEVWIQSGDRNHTVG